MPQLAPMVLPDHASVEKTFKPQSLDKGIATFVNNNGQPIGDKKVTVSRSRTAAGREKATLKFTFPVVGDETLNGVHKSVILRTAYAEVNLSFDPSSTLEERQDISQAIVYAMVSNNSLIQSVVTGLEGFY